MRLCFYNPHAVHTVLGVTLFSFLFEKNIRKKHNAKFSYFLKLIKSNEQDIALVVDGTASSITASSEKLLNLIEKIPFFIFFLKFFCFFEIYIWCILNKINPLKKTIIFSQKKLTTNTDILLGFAFFTDTFLSKDLTEQSFFMKFKGRKILHASHFYNRTQKISKNIKKTGTKIMIAESNLKKSDFFKKHFPYIESVILLPFVLRNKYIKKITFSKRKNKCLAVGTLFFLKNNEDSIDYLKHFKTNSLHPMRKTIFENANEIKNEIESLISVHKKTNGNKYHNFNIVDKFNEYKIFIAPEENIGLPSINFLEGMACGCAFIGIESFLYSDIGLIDGVNYISYDGSLENLIYKIKFYQKENSLLEKIAKNGYFFSKENFTEEKILNNFLNKLKNL